jgi:tetratricopeptide (TPR) repeat protein
MLTDIVGYSAITQRDEALALRLLEEHRRLVRPCLAKHRGREVKTIGDAFLVEFESALEAVECAIEIQRTFSERNRKPNPGRIALRIGVHAGDVVHDENDVYGDAINIVSRIEPLAEPGGICVSGPVFEQVRNKIHLRGVELENPPLKNIESPVSVFRLELPGQTPPRRGSVPFIGRESDLAVLRQAVEEAGQGKGRLLTLVGEAGVGKSRLAQETAALAERMGFKVLRSRALPGELSAPYFPWVEIASEYLRDAPPQLLYRVIGTHGAEIVKLVPELADRLGPTHATPSSNPDEARIRFFDGVTQFFQNVAKETALLLVMDDLQWADSASLRLLQYFGPRVAGHRVLWIGTYREVESEENRVLLDVLSDLNRERLVDAVPIKKLGAGDVERMAAAIVGGERLPPEFGRLLFEKTGGNPFFVEEVLQSLSEEGLLPEGARDRKSPLPANLRLPDTVRRVLRRRLSRVDAATLNALEVASVLGYDFAYETLQQVSDIDEASLQNSLESALQGRIIEECRRSTNELVYAFSDRQVHDLLYDDQSAIRRRKYHLKAARALERLPRSQTLQSAYELAYHFLEGNDLEQALHYSLLAAERAEAVYAREDAVRHLRLALEILDARPDDALRASLLERLSESERLSGEIESSLRHIEEAAALFGKLGDRLATARAHIRAGSLYANAYHDDPAAVQRFELARTTLEGTPESPELGKIYLRLAAYTDRGLPTPASRAQVQLALDVATRTGNGRLAIEARFALLWTTPLDQSDTVPRQVQELEAAVRSLPPDPGTIRSLASTTGWSTLLLEGDSARALTQFQNGITRLRELGDEADALDVQGQDLALAHSTLGNLDAAERLAEETYEFAIRNYPEPDLPNLVVLAEVARLRGDLERSTTVLEHAYELARLRQSVVMRLAPAITLARVHIDRGQFAEAHRLAREALAPFLESGIPAPVIAATDYAELLSVAFEAGSSMATAEDSAHYLNELRRVAKILPRAPILAFSLETEGLAASREGNHRHAVELFEQSAEVWSTLGWTPSLGRALVRLASAFRDAGEPSQAQSALDRAVEMLTRIGASGEAARSSERVTRGVHDRAAARTP